MKYIALIDNGLCNLGSVLNVLGDLGFKASIINKHFDAKMFSHVILPGVGSFSAAMEFLEETGLQDSITEFALNREKPLLGICLGMQLLFDSSEEGKFVSGLNLIDGKVRQLQAGPKRRIPHIGWNEVDVVSASPVFYGIPNMQDFYFVHSYAVECEHQYVCGITNYSGNFISAVQKGNIFGVQFHPEKSLKNGRTLIENFVKI